MVGRGSSAAGEPREQRVCPACGDPVESAVHRRKTLGAYVPVWGPGPCRNPECRACADPEAPAEEPPEKYHRPHLTQAPEHLDPAAQRPGSRGPKPPPAEGSGTAAAGSAEGRPRGQDPEAPAP
ncbi:hypothetical protein ABZ929_14700 [Streptomyces physcomitrii]|uniref:hypothetical protein n=1 Tax=Streptomyces physcomitrii TaxID=2724184 RepID=UPI0033C1C475